MSQIVAINVNYPFLNIMDIKTLLCVLAGFLLVLYYDNPN